jgi:hypothetical protein
MRTISTSQAYVEGEYYRVLVATQDSTISATSVIGDNITNLQVYAGTTIYGLFTAVSVSVGEVTAYLAGATDIESVWSYINTYGLNNGAIIEAADCAKDAIEPLLDKYYAQASLVLVPSLYKTSVVYAERPLDANGQLTFTRASDATRVGPDGYVEKVRTNLVLQSNTFNTTWITALATVTSGQTGYDGTNNAWLLSKSDANGRVNQNITLSSSIYTFSVYAKAGTDNWLFLRTEGAAGIHTAYFDLVNGAVGDTSLSTASITAVGNGYYRCSISFTDSLTIVRIYVADANNDTSGTSGNILIQAAQLEVGDIATDYIPTTTTAVSVGPVSNLPRLDYPINADGSVGCPSLLLEPQRTNLLTFSESFGSAGNLEQAVVTSNTIVSPDGSVNADSFIDNTANNIHAKISGIGKAASPVTYTYSLFVKAKDAGMKFQVSMDDAVLGGGSSGVFDPSTGTFVTAMDTPSAGYTNPSRSVTNYGNGWYRISFTITTASATTNRFNAFVVNAANAIVYIGTGTGVYVYGAQAEVGDYATSYIPTLGASVTRVGSAVYKGSIASLIGATEGVLFVDFIKPPTASTRTKIARAAALLTDGGNSFLQSINLDLETNGNLRANIVDTTTQVDIQTGAYSAGTRIKMAFAYKENDCVLYINGTQIGTDTSCTIPVCTAYEIGSYETANNTQTNYVSQALLFKTRLTNQQLQELTSL